MSLPRLVALLLGIGLIAIAATGCPPAIDGGQCGAICHPRVVQSYSPDLCVCGPICVDNGFPVPDCNFGGRGGGR